VMSVLEGSRATSVRSWRGCGIRTRRCGWSARSCEKRRSSSRGRTTDGIRVGRKRVARLMKAAGIAGVRPRKRWRTTIRIPGITPASDLVDRQFRPAAPNVLWVADITYLRTGEGWLYLAAVQDACSRQIVGWSMATHMRASLVVDALKMALARRHPDPGLIHHSDQGSQLGLNRSSQHWFVMGSQSRWAPAATRTTTQSPRRSSRP
jgi:transposase InsO family protein